MKYGLIALGGLLLIPLSGSAQSLSPTVLANAGGHGIGGSHQLSWTLGEPVIATASNGSHILTQGFHQPHLTMVPVESLPDNLQLQAFPNPTAGQVILQWHNTPAADLRPVLVNVLGQELRQWTLEPTQHQTVLDISDLPAATYFLQIWSSDQQIRLFKLVKTVW